MGRQLDPQRADARREEVAQATLKTIATHGIEGASLRTIAKEAGCTTGMLVYYFRNKQEILLFAGRTVLQGIVKRIERATAAAPSVDSLERALLAEQPTTEEKRLGWTIWLSFTAQAASVPEFKKEHEARYAELRRIVTNCLEHDLQRGSLKLDVEPADEAIRLLGMFDGLGLQAVLEPNLYSNAYQRQLFTQAVRELKRA